MKVRAAIVIFMTGIVLGIPKITEGLTCPNGTLYTIHGPEFCVKTLHLYLVLAVFPTFLLCFLICCVIFYRIRCLCCDNIWRRMKQTMQARQPDHQQLLEEDGPSERSFAV